MIKKNKKEKNTGSMFWKGVALAFVAFFCVIIVFGLIRMYHFEPPRSAVQPLQADLAEKIIEQDLSKSGDNITNYRLQVSKMARRFIRDSMSRSIIQVSLYDSSKRHLYLVDADSGEIVMHSETTFYGWMENQTLPEPPMLDPRPGPFWGR